MLYTCRLLEKYEQRMNITKTFQNSKNCLKQVVLLACGHNLCGSDAFITTTNLPLCIRVHGTVYIRIWYMVYIFHAVACLACCLCYIVLVVQVHWISTVCFEYHGKYYLKTFVDITHSG